MLTIIVCVCLGYVSVVIWTLRGYMLKFREPKTCERFRIRHLEKNKVNSVCTIDVILCCDWRKRDIMKYKSWSVIN